MTRGHWTVLGVVLAVVAVACVPEQESPASLPAREASPSTTDELDDAQMGVQADRAEDSRGAAADASARTPPPSPRPLSSQSASPPRSVPPSPSVAATRVPAPTASEPPEWYGERLLEVTATGFPAPQDTPEIYRDRRLVTEDHLPPPPSDDYVATSEPIPDELVPRSTWEEGCPTTLDELRYLTVSYWGFDELHHTGELIVHRDVAEDMMWVFEQLHAARFPMEQVGLLDDEDFHTFHRHGDDNLTAAYHCRATTGSSRWSQHAYGRAIDINPFHNPYWKRTNQGEIVLPAYATAYLDRDIGWPGMITEGDVVVDAFDAIGWGWGGRWNSLKDWQHFSANGN